MDQDNRDHTRILIVDDREEDRVILQGILIDKYRVYQVCSGKECLKAIRKYQPHLVLLDISMPGDMDGIETLRQIREKDKTLPVIIITGVGTYERNIETYRLGASDFIAKPSDVSNIRERIENILVLSKQKKLDSEEHSLQKAEKEFFKKEYLNMIQALCELIELKNPYTRRHSQKVTKYAVEIAKEMRLSLEEIEQVHQSGLIHDIGKVGISDDILNKPGRLTDEEFAEIKKHPVLGIKVLKHLRLLQPEMSIVVHHHERWDGNGYPNKLQGNKIPRASRILAVADSFDAMLTTRPYRNAQPIDYAISELHRCSGTQFDPEVVEAFLSVLKKNPDIIEVDQSLELTQSKS